MKTLLLILFCGSCCTAIAQKKVYFSSNTNIGLLVGEAHTTTSFQTINGITIDKWRVGIGIGLDNYGIKSIPVFVDVRKSFGTKQWQPIAYANGGIDCPLRWGKFAVQNSGNIIKNDLKNTFYGELGIGISKKISKKTSFNLTVGFSYKHLKYDEYYYVSYDPYLAGSNFSTYNFYYKRLALRLGIQF